MTSLQEQVLVLQASVDNVQSELDQVRKDRLAAHIRVVAPFLKVFPEEIETTVTESGIYFKEQGKELFNIYFDRSWSSRQVQDLQLNYYTRIVGSKDAFELKRLSLLGFAADVVAYSTQEIITKLNQASAAFDQQADKLYEELGELTKSQRSLESAMQRQDKEQLLQNLLSEGISFNEDKYIRLKHNFTDRMNSVKITNISKSGKTCSIKYGAANREYVAGEENMNVQELIDRLYVHYKDIVPALELV